MLSQIESLSPNEVIKSTIHYTAAKYYSGKDAYIGFTAFDPRSKTMRRKRIRMNFIDTEKERKERAKILCVKFNELLSSGWSPWIDSKQKSEYAEFNSSLDLFTTYYRKLQETGVVRKNTVDGYVTFVNVIKYYNSSLPTPIIYMYAFDKKYLHDFIDYLFFTKGNKVRSRNNYVVFLKMLCDWMIEHDLMKDNPANALKVIPKNRIEKNRTIIDDDDLNRLFDTLKAKDKKFLLACYFEYYCFVRPQELFQLKVEHLNIKNQTLFVPKDISKNRKDGIVTIPNVMIKLLIELGITSYSRGNYIFGKRFETCKEIGHDKMFSDYWTTWIRGHWLTDFKLEYKFYSLKDTGITAMLRAGFPDIVVRDQARHSDLSVTNIYTPDSSKIAPTTLRDFV